MIKGSSPNYATQIKWTFIPLWNRQENYGFLMIFRRNKSNLIYLMWKVKFDDDP